MDKRKLRTIIKCIMIPLLIIACIYVDSEYRWIVVVLLLSFISELVFVRKKSKPQVALLVGVGVGAGIIVVGVIVYLLYSIFQLFSWY